MLARSLYIHVNRKKKDFYNFDETGFMIEIIYGNIVVIYIDRYNKNK